jgi:hypothetical protein
MTWAVLFDLLIKLLPMLADLLQKLFAKATPEGDPDTLHPEAAVTEAFRAARAQTWRWEIGKRARLSLAERVARRHAGGLEAAARYGYPCPVLTASERAEVGG